MTYYTILLLSVMSLQFSYAGNSCMPTDTTECKITASRHITTLPAPPDGTDSARHDKKTFWRAASETFGFNIGLWAFDRYIQKGHFAYISLNTIKNNFKKGFEWDNDHLATNMFAHPYNGSLYYNAGRSNGYNFWQSELFAIAGSAMWEMFMECERPSTNDIIATPIGGAAIGETLYRASDLVLDDRTTGSTRFGRELAAFIISPIRGLTRIISGDAWKRRPTSGRRFGMPPITIGISLGTRLLVFHDKTVTYCHPNNLAKAGAAACVNLEYGDKYAHGTNVPYDYFSLLLELNAMKTQPLLSRVEIIGRLLSCSLIDSHKCKMSVGMYQHFDFFDSDTIGRLPEESPFIPCTVPYKLGTPASIGGGVIMKYESNPLFAMEAYCHANGIILGGILSDFYRFYHRNYNWASGFSLKSGINCFLPKRRLSVSVNDQLYRLYTWKGFDEDANWSLTPAGRPIDVQGDNSRALFNHLEARADYKLWKHLYATLGLNWYTRTTNYSRYLCQDNFCASNIIINSDQLDIRLMLTYLF